MQKSTEKLSRQQCEVHSSKNGAAKDSSPLGCDSVLLGEEFPTFQRMVASSC